MILKQFKLLISYSYFVLPAAFFLTSCDKEIILEETSLSQEKFDFKKIGGSEVLVINTNADKWTISTPSDIDWVFIDRYKGGSGSSSISISVAKNNSRAIRKAIVELNTSGGNKRQLNISQGFETFPSYNSNPLAADAIGMASTANELAKKMKLGWNAGNTLEAMGGETAWGNPKITESLIKTVKENGFNAIRLPCAWNQYADKVTAKIDIAWLNRVKEVVEMCVKNDVYVILNIHWDGGWLENNVKPVNKDDIADRQKAYWEQIATHLREFDEHLMFASANEPNVETQAEMDVLYLYHQTFIEAVRATGGKNAYRVLIIQGPSTDIEKTNKLMNQWPTDKVANKLMAEVHFYTPWNFCGMDKDESWGRQFFYWGKGNHSTTDTERNPTWGEEDTIDELFGKLKNKFQDKNIPIIIGEFNALRRLNLTGKSLALHIKSRNYYLNYVTKKSLENNFIPFYWDTGVYENGSGIFDRRSNAVTDPEALKALTLK